MFCSNCGKKLEDGAKFCDACGTKVESASSSHQHEEKQNKPDVKEGTIHKCPSCGEILKGFEVNCPACGLELREVKTASSVSELSRQIQELENKRENKQPKKHFDVKTLTYHGPKNDKDKIDRQIEALIRNFIIPNSKEEIYEFLILACSNIDVDILAAEDSSDVNIDDEREFNALQARSRAWQAKATQAYQKAQIAFGNTPEFINIEKIYNSKFKIAEKAKADVKRKSRLKTFLLILALVLIMAFCGVMVYILS